MTLIHDADWLKSPAAQTVAKLLEEKGFQAFFVGGSVRNTLLGLPASDLDMATDARPEQVLVLTADHGIKAVPTGIDHGTVTVVIHGIPIEVTTFRKDVRTDGRHAQVVFSKNVLEDAARRDFTMNALYCDARGLVVDPLGGLADLKTRRVRFVGTASDRVAEDFLRILRFFRFQAWYGDPEGGIDADALAACAQGISGLELVSAERIGAEIYKLLAAPDPAPAVAAMSACGVLSAILPGADGTGLARLVHLEHGLGVDADAMTRLASLGGEGAQNRLRLSKVQARRLTVLRTAAAGAAAPAELGYRLGVAEATCALLVRAVWLEQPLPDQMEIQRGASADFPIRAADLMPEFTGPALGKALTHLECDWIASDFRLSRTQLLGRAHDL
jgi:poly(A) polymerase